MLKGIIFDLDGVICFTDRYHYLAWKTIADELGVDFPEEKADRLRGVSRMESLEIVLEGYQGPALSPEEKMALADRKNGIYREFLGTMTPADLSEDVRGTLETLRERGLKLAIGSSSRNTPLILDRIGLGTFFDAVADGNCITRSKPDPQVFLLAAEMLGLSPADCLVVEDAVSGIAAATAGGFRSAGLGPAAESATVTYPIRRVSDLLRIVPKAE